MKPCGPPLISTTTGNRKGDFTPPTSANKEGDLLQDVACSVALSTSLEALPAPQGDLVSSPRGERSGEEKTQTSGDQETISPHSVHKTLWRWKWEAGLVSQTHEWQSQVQGLKDLSKVRQAVSTSFDKNTTQLLTQSMGAAWHLGNSGEPQGGTDMGGFAG